MCVCVYVQGHTHKCNPRGWARDCLNVVSSKGEEHGYESD
jgi:hypothetical protein